MKIAIIGTSGLLGEGFLHIQSKNEIISTSFTKNSITDSILLDIRKYENVLSFVEKHQPDVVINTAAITNPEYCENNPEEALQTNVLGTKNLAEACNISDTHFIQISTEYVFDGQKGKYLESDEPNPISIYGKSKLESEKITLKINSSFCVARTAMLFGWSKNKLNLATLLISKLSKGEKIDVVNDQIVSPSYNNNIAQILLELAERRFAGIFHVAGSSIMSRFDFALILANQFKLDPSLIIPISISQFGWKANRPKNGGLIVEKISQILDTKPLSTIDSLKQMKLDSS